MNEEKLVTENWLKLVLTAIDTQDFTYQQLRGIEHAAVRRVIQRSSEEATKSVSVGFKALTPAECWPFPTGNKPKQVLEIL
jgi:hypothetical protein